MQLDAWLIISLSRLLCPTQLSSVPSFHRRLTATGCAEHRSRRRRALCIPETRPYLMPVPSSHRRLTATGRAEQSESRDPSSPQACYPFQSAPHRNRVAPSTPHPRDPFSPQTCPLPIGASPQQVAPSTETRPHLRPVPCSHRRITATGRAENTLPLRYRLTSYQRSCPIDTPQHVAQSSPSPREPSSTDL